MIAYDKFPSWEETTVVQLDVILECWDELPDYNGFGRKIVVKMHERDLEVPLDFLIDLILALKYELGNPFDPELSST